MKKFLKIILEEKGKVNIKYEDIVKANETIQTTNIKG